MSPKQQVFADLINELKRDGVAKIHGFGKFEVVERKARQARNPRTGETIEVPAKRVVKFTPAKALREAI